MNIIGFNEFEKFQKDLHSIFESVWNDPDLEQKIDLYLENDGDSDLEGETLSPREKSILERGMNLLEEPQMAGLYLVALGEEEEDNFKYFGGIAGVDAFSSERTGGPYWSRAAIADSLGIESPITAGRTIQKFKNMISGIGATSGEVLYPKIISAFKRFQEMQVGQLTNLAAEAVPEVSTDTARNKAAQTYDRAKQRKEEIRQEKIKTGRIVFGMIKDLKDSGHERFADISVAGPIALKKIAEETGESEERLMDCYNFYLESKGLGSYPQARGWKF